MDPSNHWKQLEGCLKGYHCSCEIDEHCCYCEMNLSSEEAIRRAVPFNATEEEILAFMELATRPEAKKG